MVPDEQRKQDTEEEHRS